jgi:RHS repeat-associated protein
MLVREDVYTGKMTRKLMIRDHLGSVLATSELNDDNTQAFISQTFRYDPFGQQFALQESGFAAFTGYFRHGFTGHEMLNELNIIHMNGRIYDPTIGRFLQADPFIQAPKNSQSYNRYAYVLNNPLSYTDPSGYLIFKPFKKIVRNVIRATAKIFGQEFTNMVGTAVATIYGGPAGAAAWTYQFNRAMGNSSSGSLRAAGIAFISASIPSANTGSHFGNFFVDGLVGGRISYASGGNFGHGFWSAGLNSAVGGDNMTSNPYANVVISGVIGGTISKVTGGKFANGASSAAFSAAIKQEWQEFHSDPYQWNDADEAWFQETQLAIDQALANGGEGLIAAQWPSLPQGVVDFSAGFGDALLLGYGDDIRDYFGIGSVNMNSSYYDYGGYGFTWLRNGKRSFGIDNHPIPKLVGHNKNV